MCEIENQIAKHCDEEEFLCDWCGYIMFYDDLKLNLLICENKECANNIHQE